MKLIFCWLFKKTQSQCQIIPSMLAAPQSDYVTGVRTLRKEIRVRRA